MKLFLISFFIFISFSLKSQTITDSLVFFSNDEKLYFQKLKSETSFLLISQIDSVENNLPNKFSKDFYSFLDELNNKTSKMKMNKRVNFIYDNIHAKYFKKYVTNPNFIEIFTKSDFNCVTATALYSIAFDYLKIPYQIKEKPTHVYLLAYPETYRIIIETTTPNNGYKAVNKTELDNYKKYLLSYKLLSAEEAKSYDSEKIFNEYYVQDTTINLTNLIGIQYFNNSVKYSEKNNYKLALIQAEKAHELHKKDYIKKWINFIIIKLLEEQNKTLSNYDFYNILYKFYNYNKGNDIVEQYIKEKYSKHAIEIIKETNGDLKLDSIKNTFANRFEEKSLREDLIYNSNIILAEHYFYALNFIKTLNYLSASYKKENSDLNLSICRSVILHFDKITSASRGLDSLKKYENIFPFLKDEPNVQGFGVWCYMTLTAKYFNNNDFEIGLKFLNEFREKYKSNGTAIYRDVNIGSGYGAASSYYFRKQIFTKAKELLIEGLEFAPESEELIRKMKYFETPYYQKF